MESFSQQCQQQTTSTATVLAALSILVTDLGTIRRSQHGHNNGTPATAPTTAPTTATPATPITTTPSISKSRASSLLARFGRTAKEILDEEKAARSPVEIHVDPSAAESLLGVVAGLSHNNNDQVQQNIVLDNSHKPQLETNNNDSNDSNATLAKERTIQRRRRHVFGRISRHLPLVARHYVGS